MAFLISDFHRKKLIKANMTFVLFLGRLMFPGFENCYFYLLLDLCLIHFILQSVSSFLSSR